MYLKSNRSSVYVCSCVLYDLTVCQLHIVHALLTHYCVVSLFPYSFYVRTCIIINRHSGSLLVFFSNSLWFCCCHLKTNITISYSLHHIRPSIQFFSINIVAYKWHLYILTDTRWTGWCEHVQGNSRIVSVRFGFFSSSSSEIFFNCFVQWFFEKIQ